MNIYFLQLSLRTKWLLHSALRFFLQHHPMIICLQKVNDMTTEVQGTYSFMKYAEKSHCRLIGTGAKKEALNILSSR